MILWLGIFISTAVASYLARMNTIFKKGPMAAIPAATLNHPADCITDVNQQLKWGCT